MNEKALKFKNFITLQQVPTLAGDDASSPACWSAFAWEIPCWKISSGNSMEIILKNSKVKILGFTLETFNEKFQ